MTELSDLNIWLELAINAALEAGKAILEVYASPDFNISFKSDQSPLTLADKKAHRIIASRLAPTGLPLLSEEGKQYSWAERSQWTRFWLVDPLDGTKEFINRNGEFTVNIALIENHQPILGVVYAPVDCSLYFASPTGSFRFKSESINRLSTNEIITKSERLPLHQPHNEFVVVGSRSHYNTDTDQFIHDFNPDGRPVSLIQKGSSLKLCLVAEGTADLYPRLGPTMEWDTAAGHAVVVRAGKQVLTLPDRTPMTYNKENLLNHWFIVC